MSIELGEYLVTADGGAPVFDFPGEAIGKVPKGEIVTVTMVTIDDGTALGQFHGGWLTIMTPELGVLAHVPRCLRLHTSNCNH